jgi:hypothetical protein
MYQWINSFGEKLCTHTIKEFAQLSGLRESNARSLACGYYNTFKGWLSPKAGRKRRKRFLSVLVNPREGKRQILGPTITGFARSHGLCESEVYKLINCRGKIMYRGWCLEATHQLAHCSVADNIH